MQRVRHWRTPRGSTIRLGLTRLGRGSGSVWNGTGIGKVKAHGGKSYHRRSGRRYRMPPGGRRGRERSAAHRAVSTVVWCASGRRAGPATPSWGKGPSARRGGRRSGGTGRRRCPLTAARAICEKQI
eukprot:2122228-Prymnesium_polylepis.1